MKKIFCAFPIIVLLAAGCSSLQQAGYQTPVAPNTNSAPASQIQPQASAPAPASPTVPEAQPNQTNNSSSTVSNPSSSAQSEADAIRQQGLDLNAKIHLLTPLNGAKLCIGQPVDIKWQVPSDMLSLSLDVVTADDQPPIYNLGTFPASYKSPKNDGKGNYPWTVGSDIPPNAAYHIILKGVYQGWSLYTFSPGTFSVNDCLNPNAPKY